MAEFDFLVQQIKLKQHNSVWQAAVVLFSVLIVIIVLNLQANKSLVYYQQRQSALEQQVSELAGNGEAAKATVSDEKSKVLMERQSSLEFIHSILRLHKKPACLLSLEKKSRQIIIEGKAKSVSQLTAFLGYWQKHFPLFNVKLGYLKKLNTGFIAFKIKIKDSNDYFSTMLDSRQKEISIL